MVQDAGEALHAGAFKPLKLAEPIVVEEDPPRPAGWDRQVIAAVEDNWRLDDERWPSEPLSRIYSNVLLPSGQRRVIFKDLTVRHWYRRCH